MEALRYIYIPLVLIVLIFLGGRASSIITRRVPRWVDIVLAVVFGLLTYFYIKAVWV